MKKLLILLFGIGASSSVFAGSTNAVLNITASLASTCTASFTDNGGTTTLSALVAAQTSVGTNTFSINCTPGITTLEISSTTTNAWQLISDLTTPAATYIAYDLAPTSTPPTGFASIWSGTPGSSAPVEIVTTTTQPTFTGTAVTIPVTVSTVAVPASSNTGNYSDSVTLAVNF